MPKQADLGRACGVSRNIVASTILRDPESAIHDKIQKLKDKIEAIVEWRLQCIRDKQVRLIVSLIKISVF